MYVTDSVPLDMDWGALMADADVQANGAGPAQLPSRLKLAINKAQDDAYASLPAPTNPFSAVSAPDQDKALPLIRINLASMGYDADNIKLSESYDIDAAYIAKLLNE